jgi:hypothetical protein
LAGFWRHRTSREWIRAAKQYHGGSTFNWTMQNPAASRSAEAARQRGRSFIAVSSQWTKRTMPDLMELGHANSCGFVFSWRVVGKPYMCLWNELITDCSQQSRSV